MSYLKTERFFCPRFIVRVVVLSYVGVGKGLLCRHAGHGVEGEEFVQHVQLTAKKNIEDH